MRNIINQILLILVFFLFGTVITFYLSYLGWLKWHYENRHPRNELGEYSFHSVSLIVPVYNEAQIIDKKLKNIEELIYPDGKFEVIFVDGCSTDETCNIIMDYSLKSKKSIRLIRSEKRNGYTQGMIEGISNSNNEIIVCTDAASYYYPDTLQQLVKRFSDPVIGAVSGREIVCGDKKELGPQLERSYRFFYDFMRTAETEIDSTPDSKGEILAVRRGICESLFEKLRLSPNASFDSCVPYQAKLMGFRSVYTRDAKYYEHAPSSFSDRTTQQIRRATLLIGAMFLFKNVLLNRKCGRFGMQIFPIHFIMVCVLPSVFLSGIASLVVLTVLNPLLILPFWVIVILVCLLESNRVFLVGFIQSQFALFVALFRLARHDKQGLFITSIPSTRTASAGEKI